MPETNLQSERRRHISTRRIARGENPGCAQPLGGHGRAAVSLPGDRPGGGRRPYPGDRRGLDRARASLARGEGTPTEEVLREFGL